MGSADWSKAARRHIEFGVWSSDPHLARYNYEYLLSLLRLSEEPRPSDPSPSSRVVTAGRRTGEHCWIVELVFDGEAVPVS
jgi:hypothetical protein